MKHRYYYGVIKMNGGGYAIGVFKSPLFSRSESAAGGIHPIDFFQYLGIFHEADKPTIHDPFTVEHKGKIIFKLEDPVWIARITTALLSKS